MSRRLLQLSSEYGDTFPVWERTPELDPGPIDPDTSGLSEQLIQELVSWNARWEALFVQNLPEQEGERLQWTREGRSLAKRVELELGKEIDVHVAYDP
ncbi:hypothetical protein [Microbacterium sp. PMB16]|uniref:hypothetical protein n=1 Tax=Microbacterium sp. PMB16 TaxID=3120157 RepID=UPI003F4B6D89